MTDDTLDRAHHLQGQDLAALAPQLREGWTNERARHQRLRGLVNDYIQRVTKIGDTTTTDDLRAVQKLLLEMKEDTHDGPQDSRRER